MSDAQPIVLNQDGKLCLENADGTLSPVPEGWSLRSLFCNPHSVEAMWSKLAIRHHHGERGFRPVRGFGRIAHWGRKLLGHDLEDEELIRRVRDWYVAEHGGSHESFLRMHCTKLADLLRESVNPRKDDAGKPERGEDSQPVVLTSRREPPIVNGKAAPNKLTKAQYDVVEALLNAGPAGLTQTALATKSGHGGGHKIARRLANKSPWDAVIHFPDGAGRHYRIG